jgi:Flp pilus assembly protein TadD
MAGTCGATDRNGQPECAMESDSRSMRLRRKQILFLALMIAILCSWVVYVSRSTPATRRIFRPDPLSPYLNTRSHVSYLGDTACSRCHQQIFDSFRRHPMGRSLAPVGEASATDTGAGDGRPLFERNGLQYSVEHRDGHVFHQETRRDPSGRIVARNEVEVQFVLGSGRQGISYLVERDGFLFESPLTWFTQKRRWDLSPGFEVSNFHFDRPIRPGCLFCHANRVEPKIGPINQYQQPIFQGHAIGCERCHGPGQLHVERPSNIDGKDMTIVNPADLAPALRDAVCEQCHLSGDKRVGRAGRREEDFRPGLPFQRFWTVFVQQQDGVANRFVGQVEQMHDSRCFRASQGRLGCISCHDPHNLPTAAEKAAYYRARCLECHENQGCSRSASGSVVNRGDDNCIGCHMPRIGSSDIAHTASSNHRVPRTMEKDDSATAQPASRPLDKRHMVNFHRDLMDAQEQTEAGRDLGVALCREGPLVAGVALALLESALAARPDDVTAWESKGHVLAALGRDDEAMAAFKASLDKEPTRESALVGAAYLAVTMMRFPDAIAYWQRAINVNPWRSDYHAELALVYFRRRDWNASADACRETLRLNPSWLDVRKWLFECYLHLGKVEAARAELETILGFDPPDRAELIRSFSVLSQ